MKFNLEASSSSCMWRTNTLEMESHWEESLFVVELFFCLSTNIADNVSKHDALRKTLFDVEIASDLERERRAQFCAHLQQTTGANFHSIWRLHLNTSQTLSQRFGFAFSHIKLRTINLCYKNLLRGFIINWRFPRSHQKWNYRSVIYGAATIKVRHPQPTNGDSKLENKLILQTQLGTAHLLEHAAQPFFSLSLLSSPHFLRRQPQTEHCLYAFRTSSVARMLWYWLCAIVRSAILRKTEKRFSLVEWKTNEVFTCFANWSESL